MILHDSSQLWHVIHLQGSSDQVVYRLIPANSYNNHCMTAHYTYTMWPHHPVGALNTNSSHAFSDILFSQRTVALTTLGNRQHSTQRKHTSAMHEKNSIN